jgi:hypothetical protein
MRKLSRNLRGSRVCDKCFEGGMPTAINLEVMTRWLLVLTLLVVSSTASAQPGPSTDLAAATENAATTAKDAEYRVARLAVNRAALAQRYQDELDAIDRLKKQRASWHHDRELRDSLSNSADTANQLGAVTHELDKASATLASARRAYLAAIDAERNAGAIPLRALQLDRARGTLGQQVKDVPRRIVLPDLEVDPLADPEELDQRAAELRASEDELNRELAGLAAQAAELDRLTLLRKQHDRAGDLLNRDDDQALRNTTHRTGEDVASAGGSHVPGAPGAPPLTFDNYVTVVLADVVDASTIKSFAEAQLSGDPTQRAEAAHKAHDAVAKRLEQVRKRRAEIEARSRQLRVKG